MKKSAYFFLLTLAVFIFLAGCGTDEPASARLTASLSELSGSVDMKLSDQAEFTPATADQVLDVNGQVQTGEDGRVRLNLSSGTIIRVAPSSLFTLTSNKEVDGDLFSKLKLEAGKLFIILNGGQADVETPSGVASVFGSYLSVQVENGNIVVTCLEGNCSFNNPNGDLILIPEGYKMTLIQNPNTGEWGSPLLGPMSPEDFQDWLDKNPDAKEIIEQGIAALAAALNDTPPTEVATEAATEAATEESSSGGSCSQIQEPADGSSLAKIGQVNFAWSEQPNASVYVITFVNADGSSARIETSSNNAAFYIEVLPAGGNYQWFVTAYGADGSEICTSESVSFSKPKADPTDKPKPEKNEESEKPEESAPYCDPCDYYGGCYYDPYYLCSGY